MHHIGDKKNTMEGVMHIITYGRIQHLTLYRDVGYL